MYAINLDGNRIARATFPQFADAESILVESLPDGDICDYLYVDGEYIYDEAPWKSSARIISEVNELKANLAATDYIACKIAEGTSTREEYERELAQRQAWRDRINELEN